jgi:predicted HTH domain antitoxin
MVNFDVRDAGFPHKEYKEFLSERGIRIKEYNEDLKQYRLVIYPQIREKEI